MTRVRDEMGILPCCWDTCERDASTLYQVVITETSRAHREWTAAGLWLPVPEQVKRVIYTFCSEAHRMLYVNAHTDRGNLPLGSRGLIR